MSKYKNITKKALEAKLSAIVIKEGRISYNDKHSERMNPTLEDQLRRREHSLGNHVIFPESDETHFEEKLLSKRFEDVLKNYKRHHGVDNINSMDVKINASNTIKEIEKIESGHQDELIELAINLIREEYDITEDDVNIEAKLVSVVSLDSGAKNAVPKAVKDMKFDNHDSISNANKEVYKRRFINVMIQGAAKKCNHMFHLLDSEITNIDRRLPDMYSKLMSAADYSYLIFDDTEQKVAGGVVQVELPLTEEDKPTIRVEALTLPVLIHELVKGVMELLSVHGLPQDQKMAEYVIAKADFVEAEPWDMRLGPVLWERFTDLIDAADFNNKHHIFYELVKLPVDEFNLAMREIMAGTKEGKKIVSDLNDRIKEDFRYDEFKDTLDGLDDKPFTLDDLDDIDFEI